MLFMNKFSDEWEVAEKLPRFDDVHDFEVCIFGQVRKVRLAGNDSCYLTPGTWHFTDCNHPMQNILFSRDDVMAWRITGDRETPYSLHKHQINGLQQLKKYAYEQQSSELQSCAPARKCTGNNLSSVSILCGQLSALRG